jgi:hypothetical protein
VAGDYIPVLPDTLDLTEDPEDAAAFLHFYDSATPMPTTQPNLDDEESFCSSFLPDTLLQLMAFHMKSAIMYAYPDPPFSGITGVAASWNAGDSLTIAVFGWVGGPVPPAYLAVDTSKFYVELPQPSETNDMDTLKVDRLVFCIAFTDVEKSKRAVRGDYTIGAASGPGGEYEGDGIDIHHPDKSGKYAPGDTVIVCMGGTNGEICVKIKFEANYTVPDAELAVDEIVQNIGEMGEAIAYAIDVNNDEILDYEKKLPPDMAVISRLGDAVCSEENSAQSCVYFTDGSSIGLPVGSWAKIRPNAINLSGPDMDLRVRLSPPIPYRAGNIDLEKVILHTELDTVWFDPYDEAQIGIENDSGRVYVQLLFPEANVEDMLAIPDTYEVFCDYKVRETNFRGSDQIVVTNSLAMETFTRRNMTPMRTLTGGSDISFVTSNDGELVSLEIFDVRGGLVRTLVESPLPSGRHTYTWDGNDDQGQKVPSGLYFCRVKAGEMESSSKVFVIR